MLSASEFAQKLGISTERVRQLCKTGRIEKSRLFVIGSISAWMIPENAADPRLRLGRPKSRNTQGEKKKIMLNQAEKPRPASVPDRLTPTGQYVQDLAHRQGVKYIRTYADEWAEAVTNLSDDNVETDETEQLLIALKKSGRISGGEMVQLLVNHLEEDKLVRPI